MLPDNQRTLTNRSVINTTWTLRGKSNGLHEDELLSSSTSQWWKVPLHATRRFRLSSIFPGYQIKAHTPNMSDSSPFTVFVSGDKRPQHILPMASLWLHCMVASVMWWICIVFLHNHYQWECIQKTCSGEVGQNNYQTTLRSIRGIICNSIFYSILRIHLHIFFNAKHSTIQFARSLISSMFTRCTSKQSNNHSCTSVMFF